MAKVKFISPIRRILGKLCKKDRVYYRRLTSGSDLVYAVKTQPGKVAELPPKKRLACDLMTFVSQAVSNEIRTRRKVWEEDFRYYEKDCNLFTGMRRFARLRDYVYHIIYVAVIELFREELQTHDDGNE